MPTNEAKEKNPRNLIIQFGVWFGRRKLNQTPTKLKDKKRVSTIKETHT
ncbi:hypothetical protein DERP_011463, partial [Dermatophagoides pteronyssinus]